MLKILTVLILILIHFHEVIPGLLVRAIFLRFHAPLKLVIK
jgi:hypothetical protein